MKPVIQKCFLFAILIFLPVISAGQTISFQDIAQQWAAIEQKLEEFKLNGTQTMMLDDLPVSDLLDSIDVFYASVRAFQQSPVYRISFMTPSGEAKNRLNGGSLNEADAVLDFRNALVSGNAEIAAMRARYINTFIARWQVLENEAETLSGSAYFQLLIVFFVFIAVAACIVFIMSKSLTRSLNKETESAAFSHAFLLAQEEERGRLSRELHDTIAQDMHFLSIEMEKIASTEDATERKKLCTEAAASQNGLIRRVRDICDYLVPPDFRFQGLDVAVRSLCLNFGKRSGINCRAEIAEGATGSFLNQDMQLQTFRIVQEALSNIEKHAQASEAIVIMRCGPDDSLFIGISDDGKGFVPQDEGFMYQPVSANPARLGIWSMNKRAAILGAKLEIKSEAGAGTLVCLEIKKRETAPAERASAECAPSER